jgi:hypothetical protein
VDSSRLNSQASVDLTNSHHSRSHSSSSAISSRHHLQHLKTHLKMVW